MGKTTCRLCMNGKDILLVVTEGERRLAGHG